MQLIIVGLVRMIFHLAPAIAGNVVGVEGGETGHAILGDMSIIEPRYIGLTGW